jgi:hypothetical protein
MLRYGGGRGTRTLLDKILARHLRSPLLPPLFRDGVLSAITTNSTTCFAGIRTQVSAGGGWEDRTPDL